MLLPSLVIGGAQEVVCGLARSFARKGCKVVVGVLFEGGPLEGELRAQGTEFEVFGLPRRPIRKLPQYLADMWRLQRRLRQFLLDHKVNAIQTNNLGSQDFLLLAVAHQLKIPVVTLNFQDDRVFPPERTNHVHSRIQRRMYRVARRWASDYVAVSPETKSSLVRQTKVREDQVSTVCNAVDVEKFAAPVDVRRVRETLGLSAESKLLITVATFKEQKGHRYLIEAAKTIVEREPRAHFLLVGDGELREEVQRQVEQLGLSEHVHFLGSRRDVSDLLAASDIFILPSLFEGLSVALLEAMAAGVPVVATAVSGTTTVVNDDSIALLVPPANKESLADATLGLLTRSAEEREALAAAARQRVLEEFSLDRQAANYITLYERLLAEKTRRSN